jgi:hypothetical protein
MVRELRETIVSVRNRANAQHTCTDHYCPKSRKPCQVPQTAAQKAAAAPAEA